MKRVVVALAALVTACVCDMDTDIVTVELGVDVDLDAVLPLDGTHDERDYRLLAVGDSGTIVVVGTDWSGANWSGRGTEVFVDSSDVGDADLHAAWSVGTGWWVVGDAGTVATSDNFGRTWNPVTLPGGSADLHGITEFSGHMVIVGDDLVLVRNFDGTWIELSAPMGEWGQLRAVAAHNERIYAVGLGGVVWSASDPGGEWVSEDVGVDVDLFDVGRRSSFPEVIAIVGAQGTVLLGDIDGWIQGDTGVTLDLVDYDGGHVLDADGNVYRIDDDGSLTVSEIRTGATALDHSHWRSGDATTVGDGVVLMPRDWDC
jgi:photosystem II stability/assembly factor-like uncharacterized protein